MDINFNAKLFQTSFEKIGTVLSGVLCDNNTSDKETIGFKFVFQAENVSVISDALNKSLASILWALHSLLPFLA